MSLSELYFLLRRHRLVLLTAVVAGLVAGWITAPGTGGTPKEYQATHTLILNSQSSGLNLDQAALLATTGKVPQLAAQQLGVDPSAVSGTVRAAADLETLSLAITARSVDELFTEEVADAVAAALIAELSGTDLQVYESQVADASARVEQLRDRIATGSDDTPEDAAELQAAQTELAATLAQLGELTSQGPPEPPLVTVEEAEAGVAGADGIQAPNSKPARALLLAGFGLMLGVAAVFALDRLDTRIHTKSAAEAAFGYPVIAEIPPLPPGSSRELLAQTHPSSPFVEAYRGVRSHLALATEVNGLRPPKEGEGSVFLITSPLASEGKTTTVAHVAALLGEVGRRTLVISGDFRKPRLHEMFGRERGPGLAEMLQGGPGAPSLRSLELRTRVRGVQFLTSGAPVSNPAMVIKRTPALLESAKQHWEFVIIDSAPMLVANDSAELARVVNGVLVLARSGRTTVDAAQRTAETLRRIEAPVVGIVLIGASESPTAYRYYRKGYYGEHDLPQRRFWHRGHAGGRSAPSGRTPTSTWTPDVWRDAPPPNEPSLAARNRAPGSTRR